MENHWFESKFVNPRTAEGDPQIERLEYARELLESFGEKDKRFSGACIVGSTMKGYGLENESDIDAIIYYVEVPKPGILPEREFMGMVMPPTPALFHTFEKDILNFQREFDTRREQDGKKKFAIDRNPGGVGDLRFYFKENIFGQVKARPDKILVNPALFYDLSYPTISTKNPEAIMSIDEAVEILKKGLKRLNDKDRETLIAEILKKATDYFEGEHEKYSKRVKETASLEEYVNGRLAMLKNRLKLKFGLECN
jgi:hypothetical protein